ncbi:isopentenyl-diphosphate D-isomerase [Dictyostelium purpureum]|uniref:isopentenyl-diphosphate Delta-isomerase n=1 Tax=Dictyostelium purpureum TaxID=5786 RepID=F0ZHC1_DICPU|nr:isopentenyl-diphosphate D-isomerase [Dictyostelium purpureum]EGC36659.1 isopentenyl-diphosphate D-isomerase [Dictyostelium purpureum]|eukprot:XP_003286827.1 isopentenyl-diphosphate D-isomerase [Dictyostelium purpureum]
MTTSENITIGDEFKGHNETQIQLMKEECIIVDNNDVALKPGSKKETHLMVNINQGLLHRAFSIFLFNKEGKLLLQQRALEKITFPGYWTNTVCSHPLWIPETELKEENAYGVRCAAKRKLNHELGVPLNEVDIEDFTFMTKIHYKSESKEDPKWGEHEIDHILIAQKDHVTINAEPNEVMDYKYVSKEELQQMFEDEDNGKIKLTPWFRLIAVNHLNKWWDNLHDLKPLVEPTNTIHRY